MRHKKVRSTLAAIGVVVASMIPAAAVSALSWVQFYNGILPTSWAAGGPVATIWGHDMDSCTSGSWTKRLETRNGGFVVHNHTISSNTCPWATSFGHGHPSSYTVCWNGSGTSEYAICETRK